ncbi:MAG: transglutaminase domain-containing protein [Ruminococcus sp.]
MRTKRTDSQKGNQGREILLFLLTVTAVFIAFNFDSFFNTKNQDADTQDSSVYTETAGSNMPDNRPKGLDETLYPFYAELNDSEKIVYEEILAGIEAGEEEILLSERNLTRLSVSNILTYIAYDQPHLFWYEADAKLIGEENASTVTEVHPEYNDLLNDLEANKKAVDGKVNLILEAASHLTDLEAEKFFYDHLCRNTVYRPGPHDQNIYSAFVEQATVCSGYAHAFQYLMMKRNVPCYFATGWAYDWKTEEMGRHAWNILQLDGNFYNCDVTFADQYGEQETTPSYVSYEFFNVPDTRMTDGQHSRDHFGIFLPECHSEDLDYNALHGTDWELSVIEQTDTDCTYVIDSVEVYSDFIYQWLVSNGSGSHSFTFLVKGRDVLDQIANLPDDTFISNIIQPAADDMGFYNWSSAYWNCKFTALMGEDYYYIEYQLDFN